MGCCVSTSTTAKQQQQRQRHASSANSRRCEGKAAPTPLIEEEAVKEVLSETPALKPFPTKVEVEEKSPPTPKLFSKETEEEEREKPDKVPVSAVEEISEVFEICSMSESVSTTTITERRDDDERSRDEGEVRQRVVRSPARFHGNHRSLSGDVGPKMEWGAGKSPARRSEPSPGKMRSVPARDGNRPTVRQADGRRQDPGENSVRRSRSPAVRSDNGSSRSGIGRSSSSRKTGQSPSRIPVAAPGRSRKIEQAEKEEQWRPSSAPLAPPTNESLENPLVSLECFIFL